MDPLRIAIADDDRIVCHALEQMLESLGHEVVGVAEDGRSLIRLCQAKNPDLVITDNLMPDMNGVDAAATIYERRPVPIVLLSAYCDRDLVLDAEQKHVLVYLVKPIVQSHLEAAIARCRSQINPDPSLEMELETVASQLEPVGLSPRLSRQGTGLANAARRPR